jgi:hypothetical protein
MFSTHASPMLSKPIMAKIEGFKDKIVIATLIALFAI